MKYVGKESTAITEYELPISIGEPLSVLEKHFSILDKNQITIPEPIWNAFRSLQNDFYQQNSQGRYLIKVAVAGAFSCGKSKFINSILGDDLAPVELHPLTHCITSFYYGEKERITDEKDSILSREEYRKFVQDENAINKSFSIAYPCDRLKGMILMDSPGFGAPGFSKETIIADHDSLLSTDAMKSSDVVFFLVDIHDGTLKKDSLDRLKEIHNIVNDIQIEISHKLIYIVLTWADKKSTQKHITIAKEIQRICDNEQIMVKKILPYSSVPEKWKQESVEYFINCQNQLFEIIKDLADRRQYIIKYRKSCEFDIFMQKTLKLMLIVYDWVNSEIKRYSDFEYSVEYAIAEDNFESLVERSAFILYDTCVKKLNKENNYRYLIKKTDLGIFSDYKIYTDKMENITKLTPEEIYEFNNKMFEISKKYEFNSFINESLHDVYEQTLRERIDLFGGPWYTYWKSDAKSIESRKEDEIKKFIENGIRPVLTQRISEKLQTVLNQRKEALKNVVNNKQILLNNLLVNLNQYKGLKS